MLLSNQQKAHVLCKIAEIIERVHEAAAADVASAEIAETDRARWMAVFIRALCHGFQELVEGGWKLPQDLLSLTDQAGQTGDVLELIGRLREHAAELVAED